MLESMDPIAQSDQRYLMPCLGCVGRAKIMRHPGYAIVQSAMRAQQSEWISQTWRQFCAYFILFFLKQRGQVSHLH
jgi:hypothetical protein